MAPEPRPGAPKHDPLPTKVELTDINFHIVLADFVLKPGTRIADIKVGYRSV